MRDDGRDIRAADYDRHAVRELAPPRSPLPPLKPRRLDPAALPSMPVARIPAFDRDVKRNPNSDHFVEGYDFSQLGRRW